MNQGYGEMLFGDVINDFFEMPVYRLYGLLKTDVYQKGDNYVLEMDVAGFEKKDIKIDFNNGNLTVIAKKDSIIDNQDYLRRERFYGEVKRSYYVGDIDQSLIQANVENGLLKLVFPKSKSEEETKTKIDIR